MLDYPIPLLHSRIRGTTRVHSIPVLPNLCAISITSTGLALLGVISNGIVITLAKRHINIKIV